LRAVGKTRKLVIGSASVWLSAAPRSRVQAVVVDAFDDEIGLKSGMGTHLR